MYMRKLIGLVNFNNDKLPEDLIKVLAEISDNVIVISHKENYLKIIKESCINNWVFSSSDLTPNTKKIKIDFDNLLKIKDKNFLLLGFAMKKLLKHLGYKMYKRSRAMKMKLVTPPYDLFHNVQPQMELVKKEKHYFDIYENPMKKIETLLTHKNILAIAQYKKILLLDFNPEYSEDGMQILENWII